MTSRRSQESELIRRTARLMEPLKSALQIITSRSDSLPAEPIWLIEALRPVMHTIASSERELAPLRAEWCRQNCAMNAELQQITDQHSELLQTVLKALETVSAELALPRAELARRLDVTQRRAAMQQAYQA